MKNKNLQWCENCNIPILQDINYCPLCNKKLKTSLTDIRPVFPEERYLIEFILKMDYNSLKDKSIWCNNNTYLINGCKYKISNEMFKTINHIEYINYIKSKKVETGLFEIYINKFIQANKEYLKQLTDEAMAFINTESNSIDRNKIYVSFSGGKDSTVVADLVLKTLGVINCVFADTSLEHPLTFEYIKRFKKQKNINFFVAKNTDSKFYDVAERIGPPARLLRWCCFMFKTGPVNRLLNEKFGNAKLAFYGIRKRESISRSKYNRSENNDEHTKIANQVVSSPIFEWAECDIWLYILANKIDYNKAYNYGYKRVGCWCCPNCSDRSEFMAKITIPEQYEKWHNFLLKFAENTNKANPTKYVEQGYWKARCGGNGLKSANLVKLKSDVCVTTENSKIFFLDKDINPAFISLFYPFGKILLQKGLLQEYLVLDNKTLQPYIKITIQELRKIKITLLNVKNTSQLFRELSHQIIKFNACQSCLKCESLCPVKAISIKENKYIIDDNKCVRCKRCVSSKYLPGGCLMCRFLRTKKE